MGYGWSAKQMARVNARRARRGQKALSPGPVGEKYMSDYASEYEKRKTGFEENPEKPKRRFPETDEDETQVVKMSPAKTPRLEEYKERNERLAQRRRLREMDRGMAAASQMRMMA